MARKTKQATELLPLELVERAYYLLKQSSWNVRASYMLGTLPFGLALLYFWTDMSRNPFAANHHLRGSLLLTVLFFWMKSWQALFVKDLAEQIQVAATRSFTIKERIRFHLRTAVIQGSGLLFLPLSAILLLPFPWVYAFYQNALYYNADPDLTWKEVLAHARKKARLWPIQNHQVIWMMNPTALFALCALGLVLFPALQVGESNLMTVVYLLMILVLLFLLSPLTISVAVNMLMLIFAVPVLMQILFGVDNALTNNLGAFMNSTTLILLCILVYLVLDPLLKATYVLRCFFADAQYSGQDIKAGLLRIKNQKILGLLLPGILLFSGWTAPEVQAQSVERDPRPTEQLRQNLEMELQHPEYSWRLPRVRKHMDQDESFAGSLDEKLSNALKAFGDQIAEWMDMLARWLTPKSRPPTFTSGPNFDWGAVMKFLLWLGILILVSAVGLYIYKHFHIPASQAPEEEPQYQTPDLRDENVSADALPDDEWMSLALDLFNQGDLRLAVRALFLSGLAMLGERRLLQIKRFKSNREYLRELTRRQHVHGQLIDFFRWSVREFEGIWYGQHQASAPLFKAFKENLQQLKEAART